MVYKLFKEINMIFGEENMKKKSQLFRHDPFGLSEIVGKDYER